MFNVDDFLEGFAATYYCNNTPDFDTRLADLRESAKSNVVAFLKLQKVEAEMRERKLSFERAYHRD